MTTPLEKHRKLRSQAAKLGLDTKGTTAELEARIAAHKGKKKDDEKKPKKPKKPSSSSSSSTPRPLSRQGRDLLWRYFGS